MDFYVIMPRLTHDMEQGKIAKWRKNVGAHIQEGEVILEIETNKAIAEVEAEHSGRLMRKNFAEGDVVPIGQAIAVMEVNDGEVFEQEILPSITEKSTIPVESIQPEKKQKTANEDTTDRVAISPLALKHAQQHNIHIRRLHGSGPNGRIVYRDVVDYLCDKEIQKSQDLPYQIRELSEIQKITAKRMLESSQNQPPFTLEVNVNMEKILSFSRKRKTQMKDVSITTILVDVVAKTLEKYPYINASFSTEGARQYRNINIAVAVSTPHGLSVPVIKNANQMNLDRIKERLIELKTLAEENRLSVQDISDGTFTISNLGMFGIEGFTAIINPPQAAILSIGAILEKPVVVDHQIAIKPVMNMRLTADHRLVDGHDTSAFLRQLKITLESYDCREEI